MILERISQQDYKESKYVRKTDEDVEGIITDVVLVESKEWDETLPDNPENNKFAKTGVIDQLQITVKRASGFEKWFQPHDENLTQNFLIDKFGKDTDEWIGNPIHIKRQENPITGKYGNYIVGSL
jgi:hypothetical protein